MKSKQKNKTRKKKERHKGKSGLFGIIVRSQHQEFFFSEQLKFLYIKKSFRF